MALEWVIGDLVRRKKEEVRWKSEEGRMPFGLAQGKQKLEDIHSKLEREPYFTFN